MGWEDGLLGGIEGLTGALGQQVNNFQKRTEDQQDKKKAFQQEILKGVILEAMKPKGRGVTFGDDLVDAAPDLLDPQFVSALQALKIGRGGGGAGGRSTGSAIPRPNPLNIGGGGVPSPGGGGGVKITIK